MSEKLLIIDGSSLLSTSFYGTAPMIYKKAKTEDEYEKALESLLQTSGGVYTNGVYTFLKTFKKIVEEQKPSHLVVTWDKTRDTFRI